ncbi:hypothetical protein B6E66_02330 [Streptomyces maremycinicus]|nr:hypothetical protein B6E66_02330 [Streptomyces sp. B9173]
MTQPSHDELIAAGPYELHEQVQQTLRMPPAKSASDNRGALAVTLQGVIFDRREAAVDRVGGATGRRLSGTWRG